MCKHLCHGAPAAAQPAAACPCAPAPSSSPNCSRALPSFSFPLLPSRLPPLPQPVHRSPLHLLVRWRPRPRLSQLGPLLLRRLCQHMSGGGGATSAEIRTTSTGATEEPLRSQPLSPNCHVHSPRRSGHVQVQRGASGRSTRATSTHPVF